MKVMITEIEEFEITDPSGCCNQPAPKSPPPAIQNIPQSPNSPWRKIYQPPRRNMWPSIPMPIIDIKPDHRVKWGIGGPMIQQAAEQLEKWEKNWQSRSTDTD